MLPGARTMPPLDRLILLEQFSTQMINIAKLEMQNHLDDQPEQEATLTRVLKQIHAKIKQVVPKVCDISSTSQTSQSSYYKKQAVQEHVAV